MQSDPKQFYSFPREDVSDAALVAMFGITQPLPNITLKDPQLLAYHFGQTHKKFVLSFDKGMGKTVLYLAIIARAMQDEGHPRLVILCTKNAMLAQRREILRHFPQWHGQWAFVNATDKAKRLAQWCDPEIKVFISTYATFASDMGSTAKSSGRILPAWADTVPMIFDEWQRVMRQRTSGFFKLMKTLSPVRLILSSGSAGGKGPQDLWPSLHICAPKFFRGYWPYVGTFCETAPTYFGTGNGKQIVGVKNVPGWRTTVSPYVFHRKKDLKDYPVKTRQALEVQAEPWQMKIHDALRKELMAFVGDDLLIAPNTMAATMQIRKFMVCPKSTNEALGWGAGLEGILADVQDGELTHFVISTPFRDPIPYIEAFFAQVGYHTERLMGSDGLDADEMQRRIDRWTKKGGLMIQTIKFAESYELPAARIMYMLGYEYSPEENDQAECRIHRDLRVTPHPVDIYYVKHVGSYDEQLVEIMSNSADNNYNLMNKPLSQIF